MSRNALIAVFLVFLIQGITCQTIQEIQTNSDQYSGTEVTVTATVESSHSIPGTGITLQKLSDGSGGIIWMISLKSKFCRKEGETATFNSEIVVLTKAGARATISLMIRARIYSQSLSDKAATFIIGKIMKNEDQIVVMFG